MERGRFVDQVKRNELRAYVNRIVKAQEQSRKELMEWIKVIWDRDRRIRQRGEWVPFSVFFVCSSSSDEEGYKNGIGEQK